MTKLTKVQLLGLLELVPQAYWPPRPTRQDVGQLRKILLRARDDERCRVRLAAAIAEIEQRS